MLKLLTRISAALTASADLDQVLGPLLRTLSEGTGLRRIALSVVDRATQRVCIVAAHGLTPAEKRTVKDALAALPDGNRVLHGDFHPLNVFVGDADTVIDWVDATSGPAAADLARSAWLTSTLTARLTSLKPDDAT